MPSPDHDPLDVIPTVRAVKRLLTAAEERVRRLKVLLKTARQLESQQPSTGLDQNEGEVCDD